MGLPTFFIFYKINAIKQIFLAFSKYHKRKGALPMKKA